MLNPKFRSEREIKKLPNKKDQTILALYTATDFNRVVFPWSRKQNAEEKNRLKSNNCYKLSKKICYLSNVLIILVNISIIKCFLLK